MNEFVLLQRPALMTLIWETAGGGNLPEENRWGGPYEMIQRLMGNSSGNPQGSLHIHWRSRVTEKSCQKL